MVSATYQDFCFVITSIHLQNQASSVAGLDKVAEIHPLPSLWCLSANLRLCPRPGDFLFHMRAAGLALLSQLFPPKPFKSRDPFSPKIIQPALVQTPLTVHQQIKGEAESWKLKASKWIAESIRRTAGMLQWCVGGRLLAWLPARRSQHAGGAHLRDAALLSPATETPAAYASGDRHGPLRFGELVDRPLFRLVFMRQLYNKKSVSEEESGFSVSQMLLLWQICNYEPLSPLRSKKRWNL